MSQALYRAQQFLHYWQPPPLTATDEAQVAVVLPPPLLALFQRMTVGEQAHSLNVLRALQAQGHTAPELLQAALLHDVGKCLAPLTLVDRVVIVLGQRLFKRRVAHWSAGAPRGWRKPFVVAAQHPAWGADLAAQAGATPTVVALIRHHATPMQQPQTPAEHWLAALQQADDTS